MILVKCPNEGCDAEICSSLISFHMDTDCDFMVVDCKYKNVGCTAPLLRKDAKEHENDDRIHLRVVMGSVAKMQESMAQMLSTVQNMQKEIKTLKDTQSTTTNAIYNIRLAASGQPTIPSGI